MEIDPTIAQFTIFSGGGGVIKRNSSVSLPQGTTQLAVRGVPAAFDPETFVVSFSSEDVELNQLVIKKPNRKYVEDQLQRERDCARNLINTSADLGSRRGEVLAIAEQVVGRTYLDEEVEVVMWVDASKAADVEVSMDYFINDRRFSWKPSVTVDLDAGSDWKGKARVQGFLAVSNSSSHAFADTEVNFAEFSRDDEEVPDLDFEFDDMEEAQEAAADHGYRSKRKKSARMNMMML